MRPSRFLQLVIQKFKKLKIVQLVKMVLKKPIRKRRRRRLKKRRKLISLWKNGRHCIKRWTNPTLILVALVKAKIKRFTRNWCR